MKTRITRMAIVTVAILLVGTAAFAAAEAIQHPRSSQIPVVVTDRPVPDPVVATSTASVDTSPVSTPTTAAIPPKTSTDTEESDSKSSTRELVTPKMRDDSDADDSGGPSDGDADDGGAPAPSPTERTKVRETPRSTPNEAPSERNTQNAQPKSDVIRERPSGSN